MSTVNYLWLNVNPSFKVLHQNLLRHLSQSQAIAFWEYFQTEDESGNIQSAIELLHQYLQSQNQPTHLIGHGISGTIALQYTRLHPEKVASLVLLSVGIQSAISWQNYYYEQLRSLPYPRKKVLECVASSLFPAGSLGYISHISRRLDCDLIMAPSQTSLLETHYLPIGGVEVPMMIYGTQDDPVISKENILGWSTFLKEKDRFYYYPEGGHFFHHFQSELVGNCIQKFWDKITLNYPNSTYRSIMESIYD